LFAGTPHELRIPAGRTGPEGVRDAVDVIDAMVAHPSTPRVHLSEAHQQFVSDDINVVSFREGTAPEPLRRLMDDALAAWVSTTPRATSRRSSARSSGRGPGRLLWSQSAYRVKVKTPVEFINSSVRALDAAAQSPLLPAANDTLGMHLFTRDDPDGWSELGLDWMDTSGLLERIKFIQRLAENLDPSLTWDVDAFLNDLSDRTRAHRGPLQRVPARRTHFAAQRELLVRFATTDEQGTPLPLDPQRADYRRRVQDLVALLLAMPQWHHQ